MADSMVYTMVETKAPQLADSTVVIEAVCLAAHSVVHWEFVWAANKIY
jgi:hypothetical protein